MTQLEEKKRNWECSSQPILTLSKTESQSNETVLGVETPPDTVHTYSDMKTEQCVSCRASECIVNTGNVTKH